MPILAWKVPLISPIFFFFLKFIWLYQVLVAACRIYFPDQGSYQGPLHWELGILALDHQGSPSPSFLKRSLVLPLLLFSSISLHCSFNKAFVSLLAILGTLDLVGYIFPILPCLLLLFFPQLFVKLPQTTTLPSCISFSLGWLWSLPPCTMLHKGDCCSTNNFFTFFNEVWHYLIKTTKSSIQLYNIHNAQYPVKNYQTCQEARKCNS